MLGLGSIPSMKECLNLSLLTSACLTKALVTLDKVHTSEHPQQTVGHETGCPCILHEVWVNQHIMSHQVET